METKSFKEFEHETWVTKADAYREAFGKITQQAIDPILDTFGELSKSRLLDVACGTGELTASAAKRGAMAEGLDFAETMVANSRRKYPAINFTEGDAENLPYSNSASDIVEIEWVTEKETGVIDFIYNNIVRTSQILRAQDDDERQNIHGAITAGATKFRIGDAIRFRMPAMLATATSVLI